MTDKSERNWLIRTRSMQILGPVSRNKVLELIEKGSLRDEDEVTSGNGYWFCVGENNLVERYLTNSEVQPFNPISEAKTVLSKHEIPKSEISLKAQKAEDEEIAPLAEEDLAYPDMDSSPGLIVIEEASRPDIIIPEDSLNDEIVNSDTDELNEISDENSDVDTAEEERDDVTMVATNISIEQADVPSVVENIQEEEKAEEAIEKIVTKRVAEKKSPKKGKSQTRTLTKNDRYLFVLLALVICLVLGVIYYYRTILNKPLPGFETSWLMDSAHAQNAVLTNSAKKKILIASYQS